MKLLKYARKKIRGIKKQGAQKKIDKINSDFTHPYWHGDVKAVADMRRLYEVVYPPPDQGIRQLYIKRKMEKAGEAMVSRNREIIDKRFRENLTFKEIALQHDLSTTRIWNICNDWGGILFLR